MTATLTPQTAVPFPTAVAPPAQTIDFVSRDPEAARDYYQQCLHAGYAYTNFANPAAGCVTLEQIGTTIIVRRRPTPEREARLADLISPEKEAA